MAASRTVFEIKQDIGRKMSIVFTHVFNLHDSLESLGIFPQILIQTLRVPELLAVQNYCRKVQVT